MKIIITLTWEFVRQNGNGRGVWRTKIVVDTTKVHDTEIYGWKIISNECGRRIYAKRNIKEDAKRHIRSEEEMNSTRCVH